ncbi:L,D-transpeptidase-like protein [Actinomycetospora succinea]|uniref:L,D-transpeptidase-like protein n=1 Tax=Actinomycetospora succinea TaxID=663603 RepID=A0A4R6UP09_9PSEU|nr:L,D-transpeptidase [Actinomycetospora succinea]TDQ48900.1 L,D-transpeptidase-like protein [Actinomycetospora succinea]
MAGRHRRSPATSRALTRTALVPLGVASAAAVVAAPLASAAPAQPEPAAPSAPGLGAPPCDDTADVCVDLSRKKLWLTDDGRATGDPMPITSGSPDDPTPTGTFAVQRKERYHVSKEFNDASMPYSIFFDDEGRAFHSGSRASNSHGCVRLDTQDAKAVFAALEPGDEVQIVD